MYNKCMCDDMFIYTCDPVPLDVDPLTLAPSVEVRKMYKKYMYVYLYMDSLYCIAYFYVGFEGWEAPHNDDAAGLVKAVDEGTSGGSATSKQRGMHIWHNIYSILFYKWQGS